MHSSSTLPTVSLIFICIFNVWWKNMADSWLNSIAIKVCRHEHFSPALVNKEESVTEWQVLKHSAVCVDSSLQIASKSPWEVMITLTQTENITTLLPNLSKLALIGLLIPASTADCERGFSLLKRVKTPQRNRLSSKIINKLMFISSEGPSLIHYDFQKACTVIYGHLKEIEHYL